MEPLRVRPSPKRMRLGWLLSAAWLLASVEVRAQAASSGGDATEGERGGRGERDGASAGLVDAARGSFRDAVELTKAGRYEEALAKFQQAYDISPTYRILYNIGQLSRQVNDHARSLRAFERYLAEGGRKLDRARRAEVTAEIASLRGLVGSVRVQVDPEGAAVFLDDVKIGEAPITEPHYVNPGSHRLRAEAAGRKPASKEMAVGAGQTLDIVLSLGAADTTPAPRRPQPEGTPAPGARAELDRGPTWIGWVTTGALALGAGVTGTLALTSSSRLAETTFEGETPPPGSEAATLQSRVKTLAIVTDALAAAAAVSFGVTLYFSLKSPPAPSGVAPGGQRVSIGLGAGGLSVRGTF